MENTLFIGLSRQMVLRTNMDIIANNVANMNTSGYRGQNLVFSEFLSKPKGGNDPLSFVQDKLQYQITEAGPVQVTGNPLNVALNGPGFMGVQGPGGTTSYTRAGDFQTDASGRLLTAAGFPVLDSGGGPITIPASATEINIDDKGAISDQNGQIGQLMLSEFDNIQALNPIGNGLYTANGGSRPATQTSVKQGALEGSNVKPVLEMTRMIDTLRTYQSTQQVLQTENERLRNAVRQLTQT
jgi:flagellar basal-body rod protein FlgF